MIILKIIITVLNVLFILKSCNEYNKKYVNSDTKRLYGLLTWVFTEIIVIIWVML